MRNGVVGMYIAICKVGLIDTGFIRFLTVESANIGLCSIFLLFLVMFITYLNKYPILTKNPYYAMGK
jgi:hypothetical protein